VVDVHFKGVFFLTQKLLPLMNDGSRIMNISSALTRFTIPGNSVYAPAKGAIEVLTHYLAEELAPRRITAHVAALGPIQTGLRGRRGAGQSQNQQIPLGNDCIGAPRECRMTSGTMIAALLSEETGG